MAVAVEGDAKDAEIRRLRDSNAFIYFIVTIEHSLLAVLAISALSVLKPFTDEKDMPPTQIESHVVAYNETIPQNWLGGFYSSKGAVTTVWTLGGKLEAIIEEKGEPDGILGEKDIVKVVEDSKQASYYHDKVVFGGEQLKVYPSLEVVMNQRKDEMRAKWGSYLKTAFPQIKAQMQKQQRYRR